MSSTSLARPPSGAGVSDADVAAYLLSKKCFLTALEFHQELLEANNGLHGVAALNKFFNDPTIYSALVRKIEEE